MKISGMKALYGILCIILFVASVLLISNAISCSLDGGKYKECNYIKISNQETLSKVEKTKNYEYNYETRTSEVIGYYEYKIYFNNKTKIAKQSYILYDANEKKTDKNDTYYLLKNAEYVKVSYVKK